MSSAGENQSFVTAEKSSHSQLQLLFKYMKKKKKKREKEESFFLTVMWQYSGATLNKDNFVRSSEACSLAFGAIDLSYNLWE